MRLLLTVILFIPFATHSQNEHKAIAFLGKAFTEFKVMDVLGDSYVGIDAYKWESKSYKGVKLEFGPKKSVREKKKGEGDLRYLAQVRIPVEHFTEQFYGGQMPFGIEPDTKWKKMLGILKKRKELTSVEPHFSKYANRKEIVCLYEGVKPFEKGETGVEIILKTHSNEKNPYVIEVVFQEPGFHLK